MNTHYVNVMITSCRVQTSTGSRN